MLTLEPELEPQLELELELELAQELGLGPLLALQVLELLLPLLSEAPLAAPRPNLEASLLARVGRVEETAPPREARKPPLRAKTKLFRLVYLVRASGREASR